MSAVLVGFYFIPMTCPRVNGFVTTRSASTPLRSTHLFIRGRPWQTLKLGGAKRASESSFTPSRSANSSPTSSGSEAQKPSLKDFGMIADILGDRMGGFLFQLPPSHRYTKARLKTI